MFNEIVCGFAVLMKQVRFHVIFDKHTQYFNLWILSQIQDGEDKLVHCGRDVSLNSLHYKSTNNIVEVKFYSDRSENGYGFSLDYQIGK